jgi:hypothetical protein
MLAIEETGEIARTTGMPTAARTSATAAETSAADK